MKKLVSRYNMLATLLFMVVLMVMTPRIAYTNECSTIDHEHEAWSEFLHRWVNDGLVDYDALQGEARAPLEAYLKKLSATCAIDYEKWTREQRLAFWINAYNAFTVQLIVDNYPISSIRKIGWLPAAAFRREFIPMPGLKGTVISLNGIENDTLRANFIEPRIHFALVCASLGCPALPKEAYRASGLNRQLDHQARLFLSDTRKNRFDQEKNTLYLSPIFKWFKADFEAVAGSVSTYVAQYIDDPSISKPGVKIEYTKYDWSLNDSTSAD